MTLSSRTRRLATGAFFVLASVTHAQQPKALTQTQGLVRDPAIAAMLSDVDPKRIRVIDSMLVSFGTRNTFSDTMSSTRGIGAARRWIYSQFEQYSRDCGGCLQVEFDAKVQALARAQGHIIAGGVAGRRLVRTAHSSNHRADVGTGRSARRREVNDHDACGRHA